LGRFTGDGRRLKEEGASNYILLISALAKTFALLFENFNGET
jgi:hypothetical protein